MRKLKKTSIVKKKNIVKIAWLIGLIIILSGCTKDGAEIAENNESVQEVIQEEDSTIQDGEYEITAILEGGSGKANIESPLKLTIEAGKAKAQIKWSSEYYDYMLVEGDKYLPINTSGNSVFEIPVSLENKVLEVVADTTAMSTPHEISYTLNFDYSSVDGWQKQMNTSSESKEEEGQISSKMSEKNDAELGDAIPFSELVKTEEEKLAYANQFKIEYYNEVYPLITIERDGKYMVIPEDEKMVKDVPVDVTILRQPLDKTYLVSTPVMDMVCRTGAISNILFTGTKQEDWCIEDAQEAMQNGKIMYAGKYSSPDYELLVEKGCNFVVENTMILHSPKVKEQLEKLGMPVLVEQSSYESDPLGRMEWIKLYGVLYSQKELANQFFEKQVKIIEAMPKVEKTKKTVAFFAINSNGSVSVRKSGDYIVKMIQMAGGEYVFSDLQDDENALSTMNIQMEAFYEGARDADILIYNSTIMGEINGMDELIAKSKLLEDFKAVKSGNVYCTQKNLFQEVTKMGTMIEEMNKIFTDENDNALEYMYLLK